MHLPDGGPARIVEKPLVLQLYARQSQGGTNEGRGYKKLPLIFHDFGLFEC